MIYNENFFMIISKNLIEKSIFFIFNMLAVS